MHCKGFKTLLNVCAVCVSVKRGACANEAVNKKRTGIIVAHGGGILKA